MPDFAIDFDLWLDGIKAAWELNVGLQLIVIETDTPGVWKLYEPSNRPMKYKGKNTNSAPYEETVMHISDNQVAALFDHALMRFCKRKIAGGKGHRWHVTDEKHSQETRIALLSTGITVGDDVWAMYWQRATPISRIANPPTDS